MNSLRPVFPKVVGSSVEFEKDGNRYRLLRQSDELWVIHQRGVTAERFELIIGNRSAGLMDVTGTGHMGPLSAFGVSEGLLFEKLF